MGERRVTPDDGHVPTTAYRAGYVATIVINGLLIYAVRNLLDFGWFDPWLTDEFAEVVPAITWSLAATMAVTTVYLFSAARPVRVIGEFILGAAGFWATLTLYLVWPFDFSTTSYDWDFLARLVLGLAVFGSFVALVANTVRIFRLGR